MNISRCIAAALLAVSTTAAGCSSCAKDDAAPASANGVPSETPPTALTDRKVSPLPRHSERRIPPGIQNIATPAADATAPPPSVADAPDGATH